MKPAFDRAAVCKILQHGIDQGYWTIESLDKPSNGFQSCARVDLRQFPNGYKGIHHVNLLRSEPGQERPEARPDPRDFAPAADFTDPLDI